MSWLAYERLYLLFVPFAGISATSVQFVEAHALVGLTDQEAATVRDILGREPNVVEWAMFGVMWSEHCSYKSSRIHLGRLPSEGERVLVGPGENAGVVDLGDGIALVLRIESHNHPSAIEPYQGAATGVGGILRDIFTMGARPISILDSLWLGPLSDRRSRYLFEGIVRGISGYGNSVGVPTVGGETKFSDVFRRNPLVNVCCVGLAQIDRVTRGRASEAGDLLVLIGAPTGRDGIGGVSLLASAELGTDDAGKLSSVQVGDPFGGKRLMEVCLELAERQLLVGLQDLGGGGLTCASSEVAERSGLGADIYLDAVARREPGMSPAEVVTSETQERMLAIVRPLDLEAVMEVCNRWAVHASVVGRTTAPGDRGGLLRVFERQGGAVVAEVPAVSLCSGAPRYDRPSAPREPRGLPAGHCEARLDPRDPASGLLSMLMDTSWVWRQYDHQLLLNTVVGPGGDATLLRLSAPGIPFKGRGLALSVDGNHRWGVVDPRQGAAMVVAEASLNVAVAGGTPVALVDCLNLGNPEHPEVSWQISEVVDGIADACRVLGIPVVGGNVSLYNSAEGEDIPPTPVVVVAGLVNELAHPHPGLSMRQGGELVMLGPAGSGLGGSMWAAEAGLDAGGLPKLDLEMHRLVIRFISDLVGDHLAGRAQPGLLDAIHDVSEGGLGLCLAEMCLAGGEGAVVYAIDGLEELFSEAPSRVVVVTSRPDELLSRAEEAGVPGRRLGRCGGSRLVVEGLLSLEVADLARAGASRIPASMGDLLVSSR